MNGVGAKKFGMSFEAQGTKLFGGISRDFCRDIPGMPEKFEKKGVCVRFSSSITLGPSRNRLVVISSCAVLSPGNLCDRKAGGVRAAKTNGLN